MAERATKPHLLERLLPARVELLPFPKRGNKLRAVFVDGQRMIGVAHMLAEGDVVELPRHRRGQAELAIETRDAERPDGIPYSDKMDVSFKGMRRAKRNGLRTLRSRLGPVIAIQCDDRILPSFVPAFEDAAIADHAREAANGVGTPAETKEIKFIAGHEVMHEESVSRAHVVKEPRPKGAADKAPAKIGPNARFIMNDLCDTAP